jgi:MYXO-CTERM domain-containing protein
MTLGKALLPAVLLAALLLPFAASAPAEPGQVVDAAAPAASGCAAAPPCGYIVPQMALDFPDKPLCKAATLGGAVDLSTCMPLPGPGESVQQQGTLRWYWDITQDGTYPIDPMVPIVIAFSGTATNPTYLEIKVEPAEVVLDAVEMANPAYYQPDESNPQQIWFEVKKDITVTITRTGDPSPADLEKVSNANGVQKVFLKGKSNASGSYFKEAFGVEEFRFDASQDPAVVASTGASQESPGLGPLALVAVLGLALLALRRRRA